MFCETADLVFREHRCSLPASAHHVIAWSTYKRKTLRWCTMTVKLDWALFLQGIQVFLIETVAPVGCPVELQCCPHTIYTHTHKTPDSFTQAVHVLSPSNQGWN